MIKKLLSYFSPIIVKKIPSTVSKQLEITYHEGQLILDTPNTNYSFGSLEIVLKKGLKYIGYSKIVQMNDVLVLGLGGGSIIKLLRDDLKYDKQITSVELDPAIIYVAQKYFGIDKYKSKHEIVQTDAFEYILKQQKRYDLIVIDIFQDAQMPQFLFENYFVSNLKSRLNINGFILFNTIVLNKEERERNNTFKTLFETANFSVRTHPNVQHMNELITVKRIA